MTQSLLPRMNKPSGDGFERECIRLRQALADHLEHDRLTEAQEAVVALLCLNPNDADALGARELIRGQIAEAANHPVGEIHRLAGHLSAVNALAISPDGQLALSGGGTPSGAALFKSKIDYSVRVWELASGRELSKFKVHTAMVTAVGFAPDGQRALSAAQEGGVYVWDVHTSQIIAHVGKRLPHVFAALFHADGDKLFTASADKTVRLWDIASGERVNRYQGHGREVTALALSPDGKQLLTGCLDGEVWLWDVRTGEVTRRAGGHTKCVYCVAFSPDGRRAVSGGADLTARVWDLATGTQVQQLVGHSYTVCGVAYAPDGSRFSRWRHTVRLWDADNGKETRASTVTRTAFAAWRSLPAATAPFPAVATAPCATGSSPARPNARAPSSRKPAIAWASCLRGRSAPGSISSAAARSSIRSGSASWRATLCRALATRANC